MDILYYSNYCKHSQKLIQTLTKGNLADKISCICIDKRSKDPKTNQLYIHFNSGFTFCQLYRLIKNIFLIFKIDKSLMEAYPVWLA
jgi:hypothetical protein